MHVIENNLPEAACFRAHGFRHLGTTSNDHVSIMVWRDTTRNQIRGECTYTVISTPDGDDVVIGPSGYITPLWRMRLGESDHAPNWEDRLRAAMTDFFNSEFA